MKHLVVDAKRNLIIALGEQIGYFPVIVIAKHKEDVLALDPISVESALVVVFVLLSKCPVAQMPQSVIGADHLIDPVSEVIVHHVDCISTDVVIARASALPSSIVPTTTVGFQCCLIDLFQKGSVCVLNYVSMAESVCPL